MSYYDVYKKIPQYHLEDLNNNWISGDFPNFVLANHWILICNKEVEISIGAIKWKIKQV